MPVSSTPSDTVSVISSSLILPISSKEAFVLIVSNDLEFPPNTTQETADALQRTLDENFNLKEFNFDPSTGKFTYVINSNYDFGSNETSGEISLQELITNHINEFYSDSNVSVTHGTAEVTTENLEQHYPAYSKEDIRYYNTLSKHKRIIEHEEHRENEVTSSRNIFGSSKG